MIDFVLWGWLTNLLVVVYHGHVAHRRGLPQWDVVMRSLLLMALIPWLVFATRVIAEIYAFYRNNLRKDEDNE